MSGRSRNELLDELAREEARLADLDAQRDRVRRRIAELQVETAAAGESKHSMDQATALPALQEAAIPRTAAQKVALFRELFHGRVDVFARRWVNSKKGTKGYAPACANEWVHGVCDKPRVRCGEKPTRIVFQKRIDACHEPAAEMIEDHPVGHREERLVRALATPDTGFVAHAANPLVGAGRCVSLRPLFAVDPTLREDVHAPVK